MRPSRRVLRAALVDWIGVERPGGCAFRLTRATLPPLRARGSGLILHVSSLSGWGALPAEGLYSSSKFRLEGLSESIRYEVGPLGIDVVIMEPGPFATAFGGNIQPGAADGLTEA